MTQRTRLRRRSLLTAVTALGALPLVAGPAQAAGTDVPCDPAALVAAFAAASASAGADTLSLAPDCVYTLTAVADAGRVAGLPSVNGKLTVEGHHATIARAQDAPAFRIISNWGDLTLDEVTITGGHAPDGVGATTYGDGNSGGSGGGIENWGPLTITDSVISGNTAGAGAPGADGTATTQAGRGGLGGFGGGISSYSFTPVPLTITGSTIIGNATGTGGRGGNAAGTAVGGRGGSGGFGAGVDVTSGTVLTITGSSVTGNVAADGAPGGAGGPGGGGSGAGGSGGTGAGVFVSTDRGTYLNPVFTGTKIGGNRAGRGGDAGVPGPRGYLGNAGFGGGGGGLGVFYDALTLDGGSVGDNVAGEPGAGYFPLPAEAGGIYTLDGTVALVNGADVSGNHPDNCSDVADVPGCVNDASRRSGVTVAATSGERLAEDLATASRAAASHK
jgi:hypothetical protein